MFVIVADGPYISQKTPGSYEKPGDFVIKVKRWGSDKNKKISIINN